MIFFVLLMIHWGLILQQLRYNSKPGPFASSLLSLSAEGFSPRKSQLNKNELCKSTLYHFYSKFNHILVNYVLIFSIIKLLCGYTSLKHLFIKLQLNFLRCSHACSSISETRFGILTPLVLCLVGCWGGRDQLVEKEQETRQEKGRKRQKKK